MVICVYAYLLLHDWKKNYCSIFGLLAPCISAKISILSYPVLQLKMEQGEQVH